MRYFKTESQKVKNLIAKHKNFLLLTHVDPDGDAIGSVFGLGFILRKLKKNVTVGLNALLPVRYDFLNLDEGLRTVGPERVPSGRIECVIILDVSSLPRVGGFASILGKMNVPVINIDHHPDNRKYGAINIVDADASSASQIVIELMGVRSLDRRAAFCLYAGIVADTGSFRHGKNMKRVHESAMACLNYDVSTKDVYDRLFAIETEESLKLFARGLQHLSMDENIYTIAYMSLRFEDYQEMKLPPEASSGFISRLLLIEGAGIVIFFNETERNMIKVSMRSNVDFSVGDFARKFGGGGHDKAAGCEISGDLNKVTDRFLKSLHLALTSLGKEQSDK